MKVNNTTLANQICPNNSTSPPSLARLFEIIMLTGGRRTVPAICRLNSTTPLPITLRPKTPLESIRCFMAFTRQMGEALNKGSEFAEDLKFSASEREQLLPILLDGQKAILELIQSLEG
ncbi:MAG: hypothetical protein CMI13_11780, partial [Oleibacter sp.]|nr:hypothetical protein [Thalassolituus sp.]